MQDVPFWENGALKLSSNLLELRLMSPVRSHLSLAVVRFMRFGVTAITGLVAGLLSPFAAFLRTPTLTAIGAALLIGFLAFIYTTLTSMQSTPSYVPPPSQSYQLLETPTSAKDPSMQRMMRDIYGDDGPGF